MTDLTLTKIRFRNGKWEGRLEGTQDTGVKPSVRVTCLDRPVETVTLEDGETGKTWKLTITIPSEAIADGVQTFLIFDTDTDTKLGTFNLIGGDPAADDLLAEISLLRAELDMLKRAFRRHCLETM
ncbi:hypothetical protein QEZ52_19445 [Aliisedimentitalea scapharcae]|uniref:Uncharacterized protein n=1 Tax=Aliisedimentitalea scapharcae TaxID=1524259 RepID=A0ABZ2XVQ1_9RHOB|nr:hypothetical protein K3727_02995 [Rhodobacteraceae bacterium M382]